MIISSGIIAVAAIFGLIFILVIRYLSLQRRLTVSSTPSVDTEKHPDPDFDGFINRFRQMIQIPTVSWTDESKIETAQFKRFQELLVTLYPEVHKNLERTVVSDFGLIYRWRGINADQKPVLFLAHYDVVPAEEKGDETWKSPPFSAEVKGGVLWGRGVLDDKVSVALYLEVVETLLRNGFQPTRDIYFAFGGDEETGGIRGAGQMAVLFEQQGLEFEFIMDEGGIIAKDQLAFLKGRPVALVGLAEKGFITFRLKATGESGHSAMPVKGGNAIVKLASAISKIEKHPFPSRLDPVLRNMLERFIPYVSFGLGLIFANLWLFSPLIRYIFSKGRRTDSQVRTTQAVTVFHSGEQENILPSEAVALVNNRILPGWTIKRIRDRYHRLLVGLGVSIEDAGNWPSNDPILPKEINGSGFQLIATVLANTHPDIITAPFLMNGATDSKFYRNLSDQILRFIPLVLTPEDLATIHGVNEKVSLENLKGGLDYYMRLFIRL